MDLNKNQKLKILFVIDNLSAGGAQRQMVNLAVGLKKRGFKIEFFCYSKGDMLKKALDENDIPIHWMYKKGRFSIDVVLLLRNLLISNNYQLILSFLTTPNFYSILTNKFLFGKKIPLIISERRVDLESGPSFIEKFSRQFYRYTDHLVTNSYYQQNTLCDSYPWLKNKISTIYNGIDLNLFSPLKIKANNDPLRIIAIASTVPHKNGMCLIEALNILSQRDKILPIVDWIGRQNVEGSEEYTLNMKNKIIEYQLEKQWCFMGLRSDIVDQLHSHDVLVHPSYIEGFPNVICEAMACGLPVIVSNAQDNSYLVYEGENGYLFDYRDPIDLANKIKKIIGQSLHERKRMGEKSRNLAEKYLSLERMLDDYEHLFCNVWEKKNISNKKYLKSIE